MPRRVLQIFPVSMQIWVTLVLVTVTTAVSAQSHPHEDGPTVNKCCPLHQRYENGECVAAAEIGPTEDIFWEAHQTHVLPDDVKGTPNPQNNTDQSVLFQIKVAQPVCTGGRVLEKLIHKDAFQMDGGPTSADPLVALSVGTPTYLIWTDDNGYINTARNNEFCIDQVNSSTYVVVLCHPLCTESQPCIRKCCNHNSVLSNSTCSLSLRPWVPHLYQESGIKALDNPDRKLNYQIGLPNCQNGDMYAIVLKEELDAKVYLLLNGSLVVVYGERSKVYDPDTFCLDGSGNELVEHPSELGLPEYLEIVHYSGLELDQTAVICLTDDHEEDQPQRWRINLFATAALISSFFLILTGAVYLILWEYQNIHGWLQFSYVVSLLFAFTFLAVVQLASDSFDETSLACELMGSAIHFSFLSAFFWLTSMNFDLWWTFSGFRPLRAISSGEKKRYFGFALFSVGCPSVIAGVGLVLDYMFKHDPHTYVITPRFGEINCYFYGDKEKLPYFYGPVSLLLCVSSVFFINTIMSIHKLQKDAKFATRQSSRQEKQRFLLFMKLFVVMGVLWIFEVISWATRVFMPHHGTIIDNLFTATDLLNGLQGLAIFIIFTCKPNTCKQLEGQFKRLSLYFQEKQESERYRKPGPLGCITACFSALVVPVINCFRAFFSYCGRPTRTLQCRRYGSNSNTTNSTCGDKQRRVVELTTTLSPGECSPIELGPRFPRSVSPAMQIRNLQKPPQ